LTLSFLSKIHWFPIGTCVFLEPNKFYFWLPLGKLQGWCRIGAERTCWKDC
jgi:hypothetical protein